MKRWALAGAGLAAALALLLPALWPASDQGVPSDAPEPAAGSADAMQVPVLPPTLGAARTTIALPELHADVPRPLVLTRAMLEQAHIDGRLEVQLPRGGRYAVTLEGDRVDPGQQWTLVGRVETRLGPQAMVLTVGPDAVFGVLPRPDGSLLQVTTSHGRTAVAPAGGMLPPGSTTALSTAPDYLVPPAARGLAAKAGAQAQDAAPSLDAGPVEITVLGLYTDDLVELRGSAAAAETEVTNLFAIARQVHLDSGTRVRLAVVGLRQVDVDPLLDNHEALYAVTDNEVPGIDLKGLRDQLGADLVALVRPHGNSHGTCGLAWLTGARRSPVVYHDHYGVSVTNVAPCGPFVLVHELAHNMGSAHDRETQSITGEVEYGAYHYSFGYIHADAPAFATVMAYSTGQPWIGYFSNPASAICGAACGVEGRADNVRSLNATAPAVAGFRGPPGTLSILDAEIHEPEPGNTARMNFVVRLSTPAPPGGVRFEARTAAGGTATVGVDYIASGTSTWIHEGERDTTVHVDILGDAAREPDETLVVELVHVERATVDRGRATGTILNDDPRPTLSGRVRFVGAPAPDHPIAMTVDGTEGSPGPFVVELSPPSFEYSLAAVRGANVDFSLEAPPPFAILPFSVAEVESSVVRDITLRKGLRVSGRVTWPAGQPAPTAPIHLAIRSSIDARPQHLPPTWLEPPDFRYTYWVVPGTWLYLEAFPPAPYQPFIFTHTYLYSDLEQDIPLSELPGLVLYGGGRVVANDPGIRGTYGFVVNLSAPAPAGGVRMRYRTVDGTATAGSDYTHIEGTIEIPEGETVGFTDSLEWIGDDILEGDEDLHLVLSDIEGANPIVTRVTLVLVEAEREMSGPLRPRRRR